MRLASSKQPVETPALYLGEETGVPCLGPGSGGSPCPLSEAALSRARSEMPPRSRLDTAQPVPLV